MGRRKQSNPHRSVGSLIGTDDTADVNKSFETGLREEKNFVETHKPFFVETCRSLSVSDEHLDVSEVVVTNSNAIEELSGSDKSECLYNDSNQSLRFCLYNVNQYLNRIKLGHWPVLAASDIFLELVEKRVHDGSETGVVIFSGSFDGPDEGITGLVHLASLGFLTLRLVPGLTFSGRISSLRVRVEILQNAFDACESLLEIDRQLWKKSMMHVMAWLRPEVTTSETRYGLCQSDDWGDPMEDETCKSRQQERFDAAAFYEAIKPSKTDPMLEGDMPNLLPVLRPYQRRAVYWMLQLEKGYSAELHEEKKIQFLSPLCIPVKFLDCSLKMFYNPFSGSISLNPVGSSPPIYGGILADEMGLGKTVELLACIFANPRPAPENDDFHGLALLHAEDQRASLKRLKRERVECICGAVSEDRRYKGLWVQCDVCDAWQHADCVGYSPRGKAKKASNVPEERGSSKKRKKNAVKIILREGEHVCQMCSELLQATDSPRSTGATLIVSPAPILPQWYTEIIRHTRPGSLKTCVYEGVRGASLSNASQVDINQLVNADIVLTTYDVLKEDLSHDFDRHDGDRRFLRFQKRYPVIPTPLTRIFWWRVCLDEAQMVESSATSATEMALRLHARYCWCITGTPIQRKLDDLHGLLRFLKARPFDVWRWWVDVIRDPYESRDAAAMEFTHKVFRQIMWRSSKAQVADELQIPPQEDCISWLTFSAVEEHFYNRQHETCVNYASHVIESLKQDIQKRSIAGQASPESLSNLLITHTEAAKLLNSLLKLRQACCHPQVGSSGIRALQQAPMTMEEILMVLVNKTKIEGEEALRRLVVALNGLAGIALIKQEFSTAAEIYKEALEVSKQHAEDFRLDPLLNIHILHNLAEILPTVTKSPKQCPEEIRDLSASPREANKFQNDDQIAVKRRRVEGNDDPGSAIYSESLPVNAFGTSECGMSKDEECDDECQSLKITCRALKDKYLSAFRLKLSAAQEEFRKTHIQVCNTLKDMEREYAAWWLEALHYVEQKEGFSSELIRKIEEAISRNLSESSSSRVASRFKTIKGLKLSLQNGMDALTASREVLLDRLKVIDGTMENPKEEDIERSASCKYCQQTEDGPTCLHCELDELFKEYEAQLFRLNKLQRGGPILASVDGVNLQKNDSAHNRFFFNLSSQKEEMNPSPDTNEELKKRDFSSRVMDLKVPSELEVVFGVIRSYCKDHLGRESKEAAGMQLKILEGMRKEYGHARFLARAQAQFLRAHDEIKMATRRLRLREYDDDKSIDALGVSELDAASVHNTSDKFMAMSTLLNTRGKLRYLKGLIKSEEKNSDESSLIQDEAIRLTSAERASEPVPKPEERCPICHEKLSEQKMVFQCGHLTCCRCLFALTERGQCNGSHPKWVMCPICRQHTDVGSIALVDDRQNKQRNTVDNPNSHECEASLTVKGSYGTKIEAITRRILWIKSTDPNAKVLVFSSWNDVLDVLQHAFRTNGITFIRMKGGRKSQDAISKFRGEKSPDKGTPKGKARHQLVDSIQVLLLLIQHGANGLNLLEAQHVILVEPLLNPAAEAQAVSRVHRVGQDKTTMVHRFLVKGTVEESLYMLNRRRDTKPNSFIPGNKKNQDEPLLTLKDLESLFATAPSLAHEEKERPPESLRHLPPSVAARIAAQRRLGENAASSSVLT